MRVEPTWITGIVRTGERCTSRSPGETASVYLSDTASGCAGAGGAGDADEARDWRFLRGHPPGTAPEEPAPALTAMLPLGPGRGLWARIDFGQCGRAQTRYFLNFCRREDRQPEANRTLPTTDGPSGIATKTGARVASAVVGLEGRGRRSPCRAFSLAGIGAVRVRCGRSTGSTVCSGVRSSAV